MEFREKSSQQEKARTFLASSTSDGTLRALGVLVALFQTPNGNSLIPLIGIEEPEMALHPAAAGVLLDCLREATATRQVIVTSHSPELLDRHDIPLDSILAVSAEGGNTYFAPIDKAGRTILQKRLRTPGELMRIDQLSPDWSRESVISRCGFFDVATDDRYCRMHCRGAWRSQIRSIALAPNRFNLGSRTAFEYSSSNSPFTRQALAAGRIGEGHLDGKGGILVMIDSDGDCPAILGPMIRERVQVARPDLKLEVCDREYEAWFLASVASLAGKRGIRTDVVPPSHAEEVNGAKEWLSRQMTKSRVYSASADQPALTALFDFQSAMQGPLLRSLSASMHSLFR